MSGTGAGYDYSATTFSPDGRIFQVEYAAKAVENSGTAIAVRCIDGILIAVEKVQLSKMLVPGSSPRVHSIDKHIGLGFTGLVADGRQLVNRARSEAQNYKDTYGSPIPPKILNERMSHFIHYFTLHGSLRPFGASALISGYDEETETHELYMIEPSGVSYRYFGCALGKGRQAGKTEIEKLKLSEKTCDEALNQVVKVVHVLHDSSKDKPFELEVSKLSKSTNWVHQLLPREEVEQAQEWAKAKILEEEDMDEDDN